jgi:peptide/nickel transport system substrate-binding protein
MWKALGADVEVKIFETSELNQTVIRPRNFDTLLFGEIIGRDMDLYAFWHSSQRNDPGLNIAGYVNLKVDKILENARTITDPKLQQDQYALFETEVRNDIPAVFLYSPDFLYIVPKKLQGFTLGEVTTASERFDSIEKWFIETDSIWKIFANEKDIVKTSN